jgi:hypothetical protein
MQASVAHGHADVVHDLVERVSDDFSLFFNAIVSLIFLVVSGVHDGVLFGVAVFITFADWPVVIGAKENDVFN